MLLEELEKMKKQLAEAEEKDTMTEEDEQQEEAQEEIKEETKEEEKAEQEPEVKEEKKEEVKEEPQDNYARLRREAAAEKRRAEQLERELAELRKAKEQQIEEQEQVQIPQGLEPVIAEYNTRQAEREFLAYEEKVKKQYPEYSAISSEYASAMYQAIKIQNPRKSEVELSEMTKRALLIKASEYANKGYENPVEEMFHEAKELGYTGKYFQREEVKPEPKEEKLQPDLAKVAKNRQRSSGMTGSNGKSEGMMTSAAASELTAAEWARLPIAEKRRLMYGV